jgi:hypothetical protein
MMVVRGDFRSIQNSKVITSNRLRNLGHDLLVLPTPHKIVPCELHALAPTSIINPLDLDNYGINYHNGGK